MDQYLIYLRKSRTDALAEKKGEGETLARHEKILLNLAHAMHLNVAAVYKELVSGETIAARPVVQQVLAEIETGKWTGCLVMEVERLARGDTMDQGIVAQTFKYSGTKIITPSKVYDPESESDEEYFEFGLFMSRREYKTINRRIQQGRVASVKEGRYVGNKPPYGYKRIKIEGDKGYTLEIDSKEAEIVTMIYMWKAYGIERIDEYGNPFTQIISSRAIAIELTKLKIPTRHSDRWAPESVRGILNNPVYYGYLVWNGRKEVKKMVNGTIVKSRPRNKQRELYKGLHPSIIAEELAILALKQCALSVPIHRDGTIKSPLIGIVYCSKCNRTMARRPANKNKVQQRHSLICTTVQCDNISSYLDVVEERILDFLKNWLINYKFKIGTGEPESKIYNIIEAKKISIHRLDDELISNKNKLNKVHDMLEDGIYTVDKFLERSHVINRKISEIEKERLELSESMQLELGRKQARKEVIPKIESVIATYDLMKDAASKNILLKSVIEKVVYTKTEHGIDNFNIDVYPKIPEKMED